MDKNNKPSPGFERECPRKCALVVGVTGIQGPPLAARLINQGWNVTGLARRYQSDLPKSSSVLVDLNDADATQAALADVHPTHVFFTCWLRQATEAENCTVNGAMLRNLLAAVENRKSLRHVALVTCLKHLIHLPI